MARKDKNDTQVLRHLLSREFVNNWDCYTSNRQINTILSTASKNGKGNVGFPDHIYVNEIQKLLILVEDKPNISKHSTQDGFSEPENYAVDGIVWYLRKFAENEDILLREYFYDWDILGIAISGDLENEYNHRISTFAIISERRKDVMIQKIQELKHVEELMNENDYINLFRNLDEETTIKYISESSKKINNLLRSVDSQKRPILLSALMISLFQIKEGGNSFITEYNGNTSVEIVNKLEGRVDAVLESEDIPEDKRSILKAELSFIKYDKDLNNNDFSILKDILNELRGVIIPLFSKRSNYDIIGKFYEEFLRFAGVANVKKGIVLTPHHITTLFTELIDIKIDDVIIDPCCGTGAFLIAGMNKLIEIRKEHINKLTNELIESIMESQDYSILNIIEKIKEAKDITRIYKNELIEHISRLIIKDEENIISKIKEVRENQLNKELTKLKSEQLIGFEKNATMYSLAISNMLFRGDGKSQIFNIDYFDEKVMYQLSEKDKMKTMSEIEEIKESTILGKLESEKIKPTIGFINPPYGGRDTKDNPTKKEIQFLTRMLDQVTRYGIIIAPISTYFKDDDIREKILEKHTLKYVINMPKDLFMPNAATNTAIAVFEVNKPHNNTEIVMYDLKDDGFALSKSKGRTNIYNKWDDIKEDLLKKLINPVNYIDNINLVKTSIDPKDEWIIQAHSITDYSNLNEEKFINSVKEYMAFVVKNEMNLLDSNIHEVEFLNLLSDYYVDTVECSNCSFEYDSSYKFCPNCGIKGDGLNNDE